MAGTTLATAEAQKIIDLQQEQLKKYTEAEICKSLINAMMLLFVKPTKSRRHK